MMIACEKGYSNIVYLLVEKQANTGLRNKVLSNCTWCFVCCSVYIYMLCVQKGHTCLMAACQNGHLDIVKFLLTHYQVDITARSEVITFDSSEVVLMSTSEIQYCFVFMFSACWCAHHYVEWPNSSDIWLSQWKWKNSSTSPEPQSWS